jgi:flagellar protein FlbD
MIVLTRLAGQPLVVNADLIKTVEETPDTMVTLINGDRVMVKESMTEVVKKAIEYGRQVRCFIIPGNPAASDSQD